MDIPLELERRCERRWAARFSSRIVSAPHQPRRPEDYVNRLPRPKAPGWPASANRRGRPENGTSRKFDVGSSQDCKATEKE